MTPTVTVGTYLARRLEQLGLRHLFGLPGDFNLGLLDEMLGGSGLRWVGSSNELNAGYAADGHARLRRGPAAFVTTFGVGELSAVNATAGSRAEDVPVVHVVGLPATRAMADGACCTTPSPTATSGTSSGSRPRSARPPSSSARRTRARPSTAPS